MHTRTDVGNSRMDVNWRERPEEEKSLSLIINLKPARDQSREILKLGCERIQLGLG